MATTDEKQSMLTIGVDPTGAKEGFAGIKTGAADMAAGVAAAGEKAASGVQIVGDAAEKASGKVDRQTSNMVRQIQLLGAAYEAGGRGTAAYFEKVAQVKGLDSAVVGPWIAYLKEIEARQLAANTATAAGAAQMGQLGTSAKQTAAALRGVPAQFTDIITSLQGGQAPITVLLQQGGQLRDMFGGIGPAAKALGGYVAGLINPFTLAAAGVGALAVAMYQGSKEAGAYEKALILTNNAAGTSAAQMQAMAVRIAAVVGTQGAAAEALVAMAGTGQVASASLEKFSATAVRMEREVGQSVADTAKAFAELAKSPVEASVKLNEQTGYLTAAVLEQVIALKAQGKEAEAAAVAQKAYSDGMDAVTSRLVNNQGSIERGWIAIKDAAKAAWDNMANIGRASTLSQQLAQVSGELAQRQGLDKNRPATLPWEESLESLKQRQAYLQEQVRLEQRGAEAAGARAEANKAAVAAIDAVNKANEKALSKQEQLNKALAEYRANVEKIRTTTPNSILVTAEQIAKTEKSIREQFAEKSTTAGQSELASLKARLVGAEQYLEALKAQGLAAEKLNEGEKTALRLQEELKGKLDAKTRATKEAELAVAKELAAVLKGTDAYTARLKLLKDLDKEQDKILEGAMKAAVTITAQADAQEAANATFGLGKSALAELTLAQLEKSRADLEATENVIPGYIGALDAQIAAQKRFVEALKTGERLSAGKKAAEEAAKAAQEAQDAWQKSADQIQQSLTDALMRGFESGKGFLQNLLATAKNLFSTLVLRPVISAVVSPVASAVTAGLGLASSAASAGTLGSAASGLSWLGGLSSTMGQFGTAAVAATQSLIGLTGTAAQAQAAATLGAAAQTGASTWASTLGSAVPVAALAALAVSIIRRLDNSGTYHTGATATYSAAGGLTGSTVNAAGWATSDTQFGQGAGIAYSAATQSTMNAMAQTLVRVLDSTAQSFGKAAGYQAAIGFADDVSKDGAFGSLVIRQLDRTVVDWQASATSTWAPKTFADGEAGAQAFAAAVAKSTRDALDAMDLPGWADQVLAALGDAPTLDGLAGAVQQIQAIGRAFDQLGYQLTGFATLSDDAQTALLAAAGGMDALAGNAATYYQAFYSEAERQAATTAQITDVLAGVNIALPATREAFRALVEQYTALGAEGAPVVATLLSVAGAFASVVPQASAAADVIDDVAGTISVTLADAIDALRNPVRSVADIARSVIGLQDQLFELENAGNPSALRARALAALSDVERPLQERIYALQDEAAATQAATQAAQAAADEQRRLAEEADAAAQQAKASLEQQRTGLQQQLMQLTGDTAGLRAAELAALDPANRSLQERIWALQDEASAAQAATQAAQAVATERASLERQLMQALGDTAGLRAAELAAIDPANRALQERIWAIEDEKSAAQIAADEQRRLADEAAQTAQQLAQAAQDVAAERLGLQKQLWTLQGDTASLRAQALSELDASNRALQQQIWALEDQQSAAEAAATAADQMQSAWASLTDSLMDEVRRIRGLVDEGSGASVASLQAQFAIATAQTRAGDQAAARLLPGLSQSLLTAYEASAATLVDLQRQRALTAASLEQTAGLLGGAASMPAAWGAGQATAPGSTAYATAPGASPYGLSDMVVELRGEIAALKTELAALRAETSAHQETIVVNTGKTARLLDKFDTDGMPAVRA